MKNYRLLTKTIRLCLECRGRTLKKRTPKCAYCDGTGAGASTCNCKYNGRNKSYGCSVHGSWDRDALQMAFRLHRAMREARDKNPNPFVDLFREYVENFDEADRVLLRDIVEAWREEDWEAFVIAGTNAVYYWSDMKVRNRHFLIRCHAAWEDWEDFSIRHDPVWIALYAGIPGSDG